MDNQPTDPQLTQSQLPPQPVAPAPVVQAPVVSPKRSKKGLLVTLLVILLLAGVGGGVYYWQHQKVSDLEATVTRLNTEVAGLNGQLKTSKTTAAKDSSASSKAVVLSTDEQVLAAVKNYCNANVDPATKQALVLKVGTAGDSQKQVLYSADKNFAYVNAVCSKDGTTDGSGSAYYLKKVNDTWVFLYRGQMASPEYTTQYNIPADFN
jgi:flagellar basal body-associated protein FliL